MIAGRYKKLVQVAVLDPSIGTKNAGDHIISQAVTAALSAAGLRIHSARTTRASLDKEWLQSLPPDIPIVVAGTNLLNSDMPMRRWWRIGLRDAEVLQNRVVLCGVGWWQYQGRPNIYARRVLKTSLSECVQNSVRDSYTLGKLQTEGIPAIMTSCPTVWMLPDEPVTRWSHDEAVVTLTDYNKDKRADDANLKVISRRYKKIVFWPQGTGDADYIRALRPDATLLEGTVEALDQALTAGLDYVGTRLHAGIRALQHGNNATILGVDNRATELAKDIDIPVVERSASGSLRASLERETSPILRIPRAEVAKWLSDLRDTASRPN